MFHTINICGKKKIMNIMKQWAFILALFGQALSSQLYAENYMYLLVNEENAGDKNQVLGISNAVKSLQSQQDVVEEIFNVSDKEKFINAVQSKTDEQVIIIASGTPTIEILTQLKPARNVIIVHSSHQLTQQHNQLTGVAHIIALPAYTVNDNNLKELRSAFTEVVTTAGVAHNLSVSAIQQEYENNKNDIPVADNYMGVILGGDAPTPEQKILYYTSEESKNLAKFIAEKVKATKRHLLILNGPRTGQYDPVTQERINESHRNGKLDNVTSAFKDQLREEGLTEGKDFTLYDFQFGKPSYYKAVIGALYLNSSPIYVAGESTSMVSETADCLAKGKVTAFFHKAMNPNHMKHCTEENKAGRINLLHYSPAKGWQEIPAAYTSNDSASKPAAAIIAEAIIEKVKSN
jgi:hypothetical protein